MIDEDLYRLLDVSPDADTVAIRRAYQKLARRYHPDLHPGDPRNEELFDAVSQAYEVLSDAERRRVYDEERESREDVELATPGRGAPASAGGTEDHFRRSIEVTSFFSFAAVGERSVEAPARRPGKHLEAEVTLELAEAVRGTTKSFSVQREILCPQCGGSGDGEEGEVCGRCAGRGVLVDLERLRIRIPPGVEEGGRLRVAGKGNPGEEGTLAGDLHVTLHVRPHPYFRRDGLDVHADLPVTLAEAILGAEVEVPTIDGPVRVKIPPGTPGGQRFRLGGRGITSPSGKTGDHYYTVKIALPEGSAQEVAKLLDQLGGDDPRRDLPRKPL